MFEFEQYPIAIEPFFAAPALTGSRGKWLMVAVLKDPQCGSFADPQSGVRLSFRSLEIFLAVADEGSVTKAARKLGLTLPAVSLAMSRLEERLGVSLFEGSRKRLTADGRRLRDQIGRDVRQMQARLRDIEIQWDG